MNVKTILTAAVAAAALITPSIAFAQEAPAFDNAGQQIQGRIAAINGTWNITVADANGYADSVDLHQGTIINPTGLTLEPGMNVTVDGYSDGSNFDATEIDTPYQYEGPPPVAVYYGPDAWYPGYAYGWGPSFSLVFNLGSRSWQQRSFYAGGQFRRPLTPPSGWQNQPHGYIGNAGRGPQFAYARPAPQAQRQFAPAPQAQRQFAPAPQAQRQFAPAPQAQRQFAPQRAFSAPAHRASAPAPARGNHRQ
jgi:hypothetical protein